MKNQVRIIVTKRGYKLLMKILQKYGYRECVSEIINAETCNNYGDIYFIKIDNPPHFEHLYSLLCGFVDYRVTYRIGIIDGDNVKLYQYTEPRDNSKDIPIPVISCKMRDEETIKQLLKFEKERNGKNGV